MLIVKVADVFLLVFRAAGTSTWSEGTITGVVEDKCLVTSDKGPEVWQMRVSVGQLLGHREHEEEETELCLRPLPKKARRAQTAATAHRRSPRLCNPQSHDRGNRPPLRDQKRMEPTKLNTRRCSSEAGTVDSRTVRRVRRPRSSNVRGRQGAAGRASVPA